MGKQTRTSFQPGTSGNPAGRPPKARALTEILEAAGNTTVLVGGKKLAHKHITAGMLWEGATTGHVTYPDGTGVDLAPPDWLALVKWLYAHIDGPPKAEIDVGNAGGVPFTIRVEYDDPIDPESDPAPA